MKNFLNIKLKNWHDVYETQNVECIIFRVCGMLQYLAINTNLFFFSYKNSQTRRANSLVGTE